MAAVIAGSCRLEQIMGMPIVVDVRDDDVDDYALEQVFDWLRFVDRTFSTYSADSDISRLNRGELTLAEAHPDVLEVLALCEVLRRETDGFFEARTAGGIDSCGVVKGWAVDRGGWILESAGARNYCINAGGDIRACGQAVPGEAWWVGIQHPIVRESIAGAIPATDLAIATSGAYARGEHVLDPWSGRPPDGVLSVTVIGGPRGGRRLRNRRLRDGPRRSELDGRPRRLRGDDDPGRGDGGLDGRISRIRTALGLDGDPQAVAPGVRCSDGARRRPEDGCLAGDRRLRGRGVSRLHAGGDERGRSLGSAAAQIRFRPRA